MAAGSNSVEAFMPWWLADYHRDTQHLTRDQHGGYLLLLAAYWTRGGALPDNDARLAAIVKATPAEWRKLRPILSEFFAVGGGEWRSKRAEEELARARALKQKRVERATKASHARLKDHPGDHLQDISKIIPWDIPETSISTHISSEAIASSDKPPARRRKSPGIPLPIDWNPSEAHRRKAAELRVDCDREAAKMRAWAEAKDARNVKWDQAFSGWLLRAAENPSSRLAVVAPQGPDPRAPNSEAAAHARMRSWRNGTWFADQWGDPPGEPGCLIPKPILEQYRSAA